MRLIDADALGIGESNPEVMIDRARAEGWNEVINLIESAPTIDPIHAAGGCYCRECKHCKGADKNQALTCGLNSIGVQTGLSFIIPNDFCSYGERKS